MKRYGLFLLVMAVVAVSCYKDEGSYDYQEINEVAIGGLGEALNVIFKKDTIRINPELRFTEDSISPERYEFEWKAVPGLSNENPGGIIGHSRKLDYFTELYPGGYSLYLKVRDKSTGLVWMNSVPLNIRTEVARGFLVLGENEEGYTGLDMVAMASDTMILKDLLKNNGLRPLKHPLRVMYTSASSSFMDPYVRLWVVTGEGAYYVNTTTFAGSELNDFRSMVYTSFDIPETLNPVHMISKSRSGSMSTTRVVVCESGDVFMANLFSGEYYANPVNRGSKTQNVLYKAFPFIFSAPGYVNGFILYDTDQDRFLRMGTFDSYSIELSDKPEDVFPWNQAGTGRKLVYGENTMNTDGGGSNGNSFALLKDAAGQFYIYEFYAYSSVVKRGEFSVSPSVATGLADAQLFAFSSKRTLFLYAVGKTLYAYDYNRGHEKLYSKEFADEITMIRFDLESNSTYNDLYVATYNQANGGMLQKYTLESDQNTFELKADANSYWEGLVKVKSIEWRDNEK